MKIINLFSSDINSGNVPPPPQSQGPSFTPDSHHDRNTIIHGMVRDMKLVGIFSIICGILECLTCVGAIIGVPLIFAGMRLRESADAFLNYSSTHSQTELDIAIQKQSRYFFIQKVFIIISIIFLILYILFLVFALATGLFSGLNQRFNRYQ